MSGCSFDVTCFSIHGELGRGCCQIWYPKRVIWHACCVQFGTLGTIERCRGTWEHTEGDFGSMLKECSASCSFAHAAFPGLGKNLISAHITQSLNIVIPLRTSLNLVNILRSSSGGRNLREVSARAPLETSLLRLTPLGKRRSSRKFCLSTVAWD